MFRFMCGIALLLVLALPSLALAQTNDPVAIAQTLVDHLIAGEYDAAIEPFNADMRQAVSAEVLEELWDSIIAQVGAFQEQLGTQTLEVSGQTVVVITLQFETLAVDTQISVDANGEITGLYFRPSESNEPVADTWKPPAYADSASFTEQDVTVGSGDWTLPGTLTMPASDDLVPAVVLVHGSGPNDRDETAGPNKPFRDLAWGLASNGIAVLRYDKRTLVYSQQVASDPSFTIQEESVDDALAAVTLLRETEGIDPNRIYVLGHSLGGYLAPQIASQDAEITGIIIMAGFTRPFEDLMVYQAEYLLGLDGDLSADDQAQVAEAQAMADQVKTLDSASTGPMPFNLPLDYWLALKAYDPVSTAQTLTMPILILQGERDYQVTMTDLEGWRAGLFADVTIMTYPALNHLFMSGEGPGNPTEYQTPSHVEEVVITDIVHWIQ